ncbi:unnamed protein product [Bursaphelenchus okinawaensis]|uniref:PDZ domain-containing protein n=1 Tax=Bursaphelenchus okinawaensis TaxID=465554 RepID=A0A811LE45_9BILA|nr:unnamed protein product [Bursaphelenchus okinawaensis]CAG9122197.1 unnamed protein product [Bursaphelenchus okinawaensis]
MVRAQTKEIKIMLYNKDGDLGFTVDEKLSVKDVTKDSVAMGKVKLGDRILKIEDDFISSPDQFNKLVKEKAGNTVKVTLLYNKELTKTLKDQQNPTPGFDNHDINLVWNQNSRQKLGLTVKNDIDNSVIISKVDPESIAALHLQEGDRVLQVDGWPVTDKELCKRLMIFGFRTNNKIQLKVERAANEMTKTEVTKCLSAVTDQDPSVLMQSDVLDIMKKQQEKMKENLQASKKILKNLFNFADFGGKLEKRIFKVCANRLHCGTGGKTRFEETEHRKRGIAKSVYYPMENERDGSATNKRALRLRKRSEKVRKNQKWPDF